MIRFKLGIPVTIHPTFWIFSAVIGLLFGRSLVGMLIWVGIIFVSVLFHEYGHALTAKAFKRDPRIELVAFGGLTYHDGGPLKTWKQLLIIFNGPLFGFILCAISYLLFKTLPLNPEGAAYRLLLIMAVINLFWTVVNLLPVMPLDGGQLMRVSLEALLGVKGFRYALLASMIFALLFAVTFFVLRHFLAGAFFFLLAFNSFDSYRRMRVYSESDRDKNVQDMMSDVEEAFKSGNKEKARANLDLIRKQAKEGMIYNTATQYLAVLYYEEKRYQEIFDMLDPMKDELDPEAVVILQHAAFEEGDYQTCADLAAAAFKSSQSPEVAMRSAYAFGIVGEAEPTVGWLQAAKKGGITNLAEIIEEKAFDKVRSNSRFQQFAQSLRS